jgi:hypothetical protein
MLTRPDFSAQKNPMFAMAAPSGGGAHFAPSPGYVVCLLNIMLKEFMVGYELCEACLPGRISFHDTLLGVTNFIPI